MLSGGSLAIVTVFAAVLFVLFAALLARLVANLMRRKPQQTFTYTVTTAPKHNVIVHTIQRNQGLTIPPPGYRHALIVEGQPGIQQLATPSHSPMQPDLSDISVQPPLYQAVHDDEAHDAHNQQREGNQSEGNQLQDVEIVVFEPVLEPEQESQPHVISTPFDSPKPAAFHAPPIASS